MHDTKFWRQKVGFSLFELRIFSGLDWLVSQSVRLSDERVKKCLRTSELVATDQSEGILYHLESSLKRKKKKEAVFSSSVGCLFFFLPPLAAYIAGPPQPSNKTKRNGDESGHIHYNNVRGGERNRMREGGGDEQKVGKSLHVCHHLFSQSPLTA